MEVSSGRGSVMIGVNEFDLPFTGAFEEDTGILIEAVAAFPYHFIGWGGDASGPENPKMIKMTQDVWVTAEFGVNWLVVLGISGSVAVVAFGVMLVFVRRREAAGSPD